MIPLDISFCEKAVFASHNTTRSVSPLDYILGKDRKYETDVRLTTVILERKPKQSTSVPKIKQSKYTNNQTNH